MIEYIKGEIAELTPAFVVVDACGVGYGLGISVNTYSALQGKTEGKVYVYESIREDSHDLFGFATKSERELFLLLITVNGIGSNTARMILSEMTVDELCAVIAQGDERLLKRIKGIGPRTAARIIVELQDKVAELSYGTAANVTGTVAPVANQKVVSEAVSALTMLGFASAPTHKVVNEIVKEQPDITVEQLIKRALTMIK
ncbi:MAG: Holliday junction branch migration protein RuvA [Prevotellaceae bacterium]|nr:Holliday junction branch migration protein RuvA [Prevotellaceae bacterium]